MVTWIILGAAAVAVIAAVLYWLLITTEGVYLGRRTVIWLYDVYARRYDAIKQYDSFNEAVYLGRPILDRLAHVPAPLVLDVATGTGRLPLALLEQPTFQGRVIALDLSRRMLAVAAEKLAPFGPRGVLLHHAAECLPFPDNTFDVVTCLEALEFMMQPCAVLGDLVRVLRPGGLLVITNRQGPVAPLMPGKIIPHDTFERLLREDLGLEGVAVEVWQVDYRLVWGRKPGLTLPTGPLPLGEIWRCPRCDTVSMIPVAGGWRCLTCEAHVPVAADGVIEAYNTSRAITET